MIIKFITTEMISMELYICNEYLAFALYGRKISTRSIKYKFVIYKIRVLCPRILVSDNCMYIIVISVSGEMYLQHTEFNV